MDLRDILKLNKFFAMEEGRWLKAEGETFEERQKRLPKLILNKATMELTALKAGNFAQNFETRWRNRFA